MFRSLYENNNVLHKIETLLEDSRSAILDVDQINATALAHLTPEEKKRALAASAPLKAGLKATVPDIGHGLLMGGLVGAGALAANSLADTNIDVPLSAGATAALTGGIGAMCSFALAKEHQKDFQYTAGLLPQEQAQLQKEYYKTMGQQGFKKDESKELAKTYGQMYS